MIQSLLPCFSFALVTASMRPSQLFKCLMRPLDVIFRPQNAHLLLALLLALMLLYVCSRLMFTKYNDTTLNN